MDLCADYKNNVLSLFLTYFFKKCKQEQFQKKIPNLKIICLNLFFVRLLVFDKARKSNLFSNLLKSRFLTF